MNFSLISPLRLIFKAVPNLTVIIYITQCLLCVVCQLKRRTCHAHILSSNVCQLCLSRDDKEGTHLSEWQQTCAWNGTNNRENALENFHSGMKNSGKYNVKIKKFLSSKTSSLLPAFKLSKCLRSLSVSSFCTAYSQVAKGNVPLRKIQLQLQTLHIN